MKSFLMMGQSNMAGRGIIGEVPPIVNEHCFMLRNGMWRPMGDPVNPDRQLSFRHGISPAVSFAEAYAKHFGEDVGLIPCADGGSCLDQWQPGEPFYDNAVNQARLAMRSSELAGILWHQGEQDSYSLENIALYHDKFMYMFETLKRDLVIEEIPLMIGELGEFVDGFQNGRFRYFRMTNRTLKGLSEEIPQAGFVSARGLTCNEDCVHFNARSQREFGRRYFQVYLTIYNQIQGK
ncbi:MAG: sialate O-acetylesterase [Clostridia bacterium]|nr:sialate O-acetylesterase [Clostridia bacterium]